jgi:hypothetical protein
MRERLAALRDRRIEEEVVAFVHVWDELFSLSSAYRAAVFSIKYVSR